MNIRKILVGKATSAILVHIKEPSLRFCLLNPLLKRQLSQDFYTTICSALTANAVLFGNCKLETEQEKRLNVIAGQNMQIVV